ncbi:MAG TPA: hypothetical protein GXX49_00490 [Clostridiaceae bacterium]|jgi:Zn-dependent membrane protease YugP|nr:hypothetical protein [Clostridiaceae bacterium]
MLPDIAGYTLDEARKILDKQGYEIYNVKVTAPPGERITDYDDFFRVVKVMPVDGNKVELLVVKPLQ